LKPHVKIYLDYFEHPDFISCEVCGARAVDIHHIENRKMGGSKEKDDIENLMALCRKCHSEYGDKKQWKDWLKKSHMITLNSKHLPY